MTTPIDQTETRHPEAEASHHKPPTAHSLADAVNSDNTLQGYVAMNHVDPSSEIAQVAIHEQVDEHPVIDRHREISKLAHQFFLDRGGEHGSHEDDWYRAEQEFRSRQGGQ